MPGPNDDEDDLDDVLDIPTSLVDDEAAAKALRDDLAKLMADGEDDNPLGDLPKPERKTVAMDDGLDLVDKAKHTKPADDPAGGDKPADAPAADEAPKPGEQPAKSEDSAKPAEPSAELKAAPIDKLLDGVPDDRRAEISRRIGEADSVMGLFKGREAELERHSVTPQQAMARLLDLNAFAQQHTDEYVAWVAAQMNPKAPHEVLSKAAERLGMKLVPAETEDPFEDPEVKRLREENKQLKGGDKPNFGPDTPERQAARQADQSLQSFVGERDASGNLLRPRFSLLRERIAALATQKKQETGVAVTVQDLDAFYRQADTEYSQAYGAAPAAPAGGADEGGQGGGGASAARPQPAVAQQGQTTRAASVEKAKRASTSIDGSGQGADHRPALPDDAPIGSVLRHLLKAQTGD